VRAGVVCGPARGAVPDDQRGPTPLLPRGRPVQHPDNRTHPRTDPRRRGGGPAEAAARHRVERGVDRHERPRRRPLRHRFRPVPMHR